MRGVLLSLVLVAASLGEASRAEERSSVALVDKGAPRAVLLLPRDAHPDEKLAARELQTHIKKMSGASLGIAEGESPADLLLVRIGAPLAPEVLRRLRDRSEDPSAFCVSVRPEGVALAGNSLEGTAVPKSPTLALPVGESIEATGAVRFGKVNTLAVKVTNAELKEIGTGGITAPVMF